MRASFSTIYRRARFHARALSEKDRMQQRERFGVACLAQCLQNETDFRKAFLEAVCGVPATKNNDWNVTVDEYHWADIYLTKGDNAVIVECKISDALMGKQDPWASTKLFTRKPKGYGACINEECPYPNRYFVTLTASERGGPKRVGGIHCRSATWSDILAQRKSRSPWVNDLFLSLANLDYPSFRIMKIRNARVENVGAVLSANEILMTLATQLNVAKPKVEHVAEGEGTVSAGYIGVEVKKLRREPADRDLRRLVNPPRGENLCWFGYELQARAKKGAVSTLSVWLYCRDSTSASEVKRRCQNDRSWRSIPMADPALGEKHFVHYQAKLGEGQADLRQFEALFKLLATSDGKKNEE